MEIVSDSHVRLQPEQDTDSVLPSAVKVAVPSSWGILHALSMKVLSIRLIAFAIRLSMKDLYFGALRTSISSTIELYDFSM